MQKGKPVAFRLESLTASEKLYANIERELLLLCGECERFPHVYGRRDIVEKDHKTL